MKEEDEYIDSVISSAINSADIDVSMLNSDWNDLKPLLIRRRRKVFFIFLLLVSPFIAYGAYSILGLGGVNNVSLEVEYIEKRTALVEGGVKVKNEGIRVGDGKGVNIFEHKNSEDYEKQVLISSSSSSVNGENKTLKKRNAVGEREKKQTTKSSSHLILSEPLEAESEVRYQVLDSSVLFAKRPLVPLKQEIESFIGIEYPSQDSVMLISKNKIYRKSVGIMYAKDLVTFSKEDEKVRYKVGVSFSIMMKKKLELIAEANYTQIGFEIKSDATTDPTPPPSGGYTNNTPNSPSVGIASSDETVPFDVDYKANYIDFNLGLNWTFFQNKKFGMYINLSPEINYLVKEYKLIGYSSKISSSLNAGFGVQYLLGSKIKLFIQPNINYMYLGFKPIENSTIKPYSLEGKTGLKINF